MCIYVYVRLSVGNAIKTWKFYSAHEWGKIKLTGFHREIVVCLAKPRPNSITHIRRWEPHARAPRCSRLALRICMAFVSFLSHDDGFDRIVYDIVISIYNLISQLISNIIVVDIELIIFNSLIILLLSSTIIIMMIMKQVGFLYCLYRIWKHNYSYDIETK